MARSRYKIYESSHPHFLTFTIINWIPVFTRPDTVKIVLDSLQFMQDQSRLILYGYVVLENHCHLIARADDLNRELTSIKSYTAKRIVQYLEGKNVRRILDQMRFHKKRFKTDRQYQVWEEGSHPQLIQGDEMMRQKLDYIHYNPVKRGYVDKPEHWRYSSARNYAGLEGMISVSTRW